MAVNIHASPPQLHPLHRALKSAWQKLIVTREVKQAWLAIKCGCDESRISRWINPNVEDFPPTLQMAKLIEALQEWPGVERWEPLEAFNEYFGCRVAELHRAHRPLTALMSILATDQAKVVSAFISAMAQDGPDLTDHERALLAPMVHHLRRIADDLDDELTGGAFVDLEATP